MAFNEAAVETDVLIAGGGMAGLFAAIAAKNSGLDVVLADKAYVSKSGGGAYTEAHTSPFNPAWGEDANTEKTRAFRASEYILNQDWLQIYLDDSLARFNDVLSWGAKLKTDIDNTGKPVDKRHGLIVVARTLLPGVRARALKLGVKILDRIMITDVIKQDNTIVGAVGFDTRSGDFYTIKAKATILCMGNVGLKTQQTHNMDYWTGDGHAIGYRAGAEIINKEFGYGGGGWAKYPTLPGAPMGGAAHMINAEGQPLRENSALLEAHAGRGPIYADNTSLTPKEIKQYADIQSTSQRDYIMKKIGFEVAGSKLELWLSSGGVTTEDGANSGVAVNTKCETQIPGLYAAGDNAGTCISGSRYIGIGHALMIGAVTGHVAGENAADYARKAQKPAIDTSNVKKLSESTYAPIQRKGGFSVDYVLQMLQNTVVPYYILGVKNGKRLQAALTLVEFINEHLVPMLRTDDPHGLRMAIEVKNMALNSEMVLRSSLFRTESRGVHYREDYPLRNDPEWLAWTVLKEVDGHMEVYKRPIPKEWWPDLSIPYEERYPSRLPR